MTSPAPLPPSASAAPSSPAPISPAAPSSSSLPREWTSDFAVITLHSYSAHTLRLYYTPQPEAPVVTDGLDLAPLFEVLPGLRRHRCDNGRHLDFATEARHTELAHLFEHLLVELLVQDGQPRAQIQGATNLDEAPVRYRIKVSGWNSPAQVEKIIEKALRLLESPALRV